MKARRHASYGAATGMAFLFLGMLLQAGLGDGEGGIVLRLGRTLTMPITWLAAIAAWVLGLLVGARANRLIARESEDRDERDRKERAASALQLGRAARALHTGTQALLSSATSSGGLTSQAAGSFRESATSVRQLGENAARARQDAERFVGLAELSKRRSREGLLEIYQSADELSKLTDEVRGLAGGIEGLNDRMRSIVGMASAMNNLGEKFESLADSAAEEMAQASSELPLGLHFIVSEMRRQGKDARNGAALVQGIVAELQKAMAATAATAEKGVSRAERGAQVANRLGKTIEQIGDALEASADAAADMVSLAGRQHEGLDAMARAVAQAQGASEEANASVQRVAREAKDLSRLSSELRGFIQQSHEGRLPAPASPTLVQLTAEAS